MADDNVRVHVNHGDSFFSDSVTISHNQANIVIDFKQRSPRFDPLDNQGNEQTTLVIKHNAIIMDAKFAKHFLKSLEDNIKKYEKRFGKIDVKKKKSVKKGKRKTAVDADPYIG